MTETVPNPSVLKLLASITDRLAAVDARVEIGGLEPKDPRLLFVELKPQARIVVVFDSPPDDRAAKLGLLSELAAAFAFTADLSTDAVGLGRELSSRRLDDELATLADRAGALRGVVIDTQSPVLWGTSELRRGDEDVDSALAAARSLTTAEQHGVDFAELLELGRDGARRHLEDRGLDPTVVSSLERSAERVRQGSVRSGAAWRSYLLLAQAISDVRRDGDSGASRRLVSRGGFGYLARSFANIYWLVLVFDGNFSELAADGALLHALPLIEKLVLALPPVDPVDPGGKVIRLPRPT